MKKIEDMSKGRIILQIIVTILVTSFGQMLGATVCDLILHNADFPQDWIYQAIRVPVYILTVWVCCQVYTGKFLHMKLSDFRITKVSLKLGDFLLALGLPTFVYILFAVIGTPIWNTQLTNADRVERILTEILEALLAGVTEEILFRGYIMKMVEIKWGRTIAIIAPAFLFSLFHIPSMNYRDPLSLFLMILGVTLVGMLLSLTTYLRGCIWGSVLIHVIWNFLVGRTIFVGSEVRDNAILSIEVPNNPLLTGAGFGIEASIVAIIGYAIFAFLVFRAVKGCQEKQI